MKRLILIFLVISIGPLLNAQNVAITDDGSYAANPSAMLDVKSITKGMLVPRLSTLQRTAIASPATGLLVFDTNFLSFFFYNGSSWVNLSVANDNPWNMGSSGVYLANNALNLGVGTNSPNGKLEIQGDGSVVTDELLMAVKNANGDTVFAVYSGGVRIYVDDAPSKGTGSRGGFAVGGFSTGKGTLTNEYLRITPDSIRLYVDDNPQLKGTGSRGGFAVGGFSTGKTITNEYLRVSPDSVRIYVDPNAKGTGSRGGFAVGGFSTGKSTPSDFMQITKDNYFIGLGAGLNNTDGIYNSFMGYESGFLNTTGSNNLFIGFQSGFKNTSGSYNTFLGYNTGFNNNANFNSFVGYQAGKANTSGTYNSFMGYNAGLSNQGGSSNVFIGFQSGMTNTSGINNVFIGKNAGLNCTGNNNILIGLEAGKVNTGNDNIFIGLNAGMNLTTGIHNLFIGSGAGYSQTNQDYNLMLGTGAGYNIISSGWNGSFNSFLGINAGNKIKNSKENAFIGTNAGAMLEDGWSNTIVGICAAEGGAWDPGVYHSGYITSRNTIIGCKAGQILDIGSDNIFIGYQAGSGLTNASNQLYIGSAPLIYGDFSAPALRLNGNVGILKTAGYALDVAGDVNITGSYKINGANLFSSQWINTSGSDIYFNTGNVGIGTTTPSQKLQVTGNGIFNTAFIGDAGHGSTYAAFAHSNSATVQGYALLQSSDGLNTYINKKSGAGFIYFRVDNNDKMYMDNNGNFGIGTVGALTRKLQVSGDASVTGNIAAATVNATTFTGAVSGNVTGNVSGDVTGNLSGNVNGFTMGKIFMSASGIIVSNNTRFVLYWDSHGILSIKNDVPKVGYNCWYWYQSQIGSNPSVGGSGLIEPGTQVDIPCTDGEGFEIHFADQLGNSVCSVWVQWAHGPLLGHYTMYGQDK